MSEPNVAPASGRSLNPAEALRVGFVAGWYSARRRPEIAAATHSPDYPGDVSPNRNA